MEKEQNGQPDEPSKEVCTRGPKRVFVPTALCELIVHRAMSALKNTAEEITEIKTTDLLSTFEKEFRGSLEEMANDEFRSGECLTARQLNAMLAEVCALQHEVRKLNRNVQELRDKLRISDENRDNAPDWSYGRTK